MSDPPGATVTNLKTQATYVTPTKIVNPHHSIFGDKHGCYLAPGYSAKWASGATTQTKKIIRLCDWYKNGFHWTLTLNRPAGVPGLAADIKAAKEQKEASEQAAREKKAAALAAALQRKREAAARAQKARQQAAQLGKALGEIAGAALIGAAEVEAAKAEASSGGYSTPMPTYQFPIQPIPPAPKPIPFHYSPALQSAMDSKPITLCPDGSYVSGTCRLAPNGTYVGQ